MRRRWRRRKRPCAPHEVGSEGVGTLHTVTSLWRRRRTRCRCRSRRSARRRCRPAGNGSWAPLPDGQRRCVAGRAATASLRRRDGWLPWTPTRTHWAATPRWRSRRWSGGACRCEGGERWVRQWPDRGAAPGTLRALAPSLTEWRGAGREGAHDDRAAVATLSSWNDEERWRGGAIGVPSIPARSRTVARNTVRLAVPPCPSQCVGSGECRAEFCALGHGRGVRATAEGGLGGADRAGPGKTGYTFPLSQKSCAGGDAPHPSRSAAAAAM